MLTGYSAGYGSGYGAYLLEEALSSKGEAACSGWLEVGLLSVSSAKGK